MSSLIYLIAMLAVGWLVLWTIRDPKEPKWDWWPIDWWPFDTQSEEALAGSADGDGPPNTYRGQAVPWRERRSMNRPHNRSGRIQPVSRPAHRQPMGRPPQR